MRARLRRWLEAHGGSSPFARLRNRLVLMVMGITTVILLIAFTAIFVVASASQNRSYSVPIFETSGGVQERVESFIESQVRAEREHSLSGLIATLAVAGVCIELAVFAMALFIAEESIRPLRETYEAERDFIANASHEIKTPLAVIQANLEAADLRENRWVRNAEQKVAELTELNNQLLALTRAGAPVEAEALATVDLGGLTAELLAPLEPQLRARGIRLEYHHEGNLTAKKVATGALRQVLNILLDNAIKYAGKKIKVSVASGEITVQNDGTRLKPADTERIFERFYQVDKTKNGVGLGLAIARQVAEREKWRLTAESGRLTTFRLRL